MEEYTVFKENFAKKLREMRLAYGMTQEEFAEKLDVSYTTYVKVERNKRAPSADFLRHLKEHTGVPVDYLISDEYSELEMIWSMVNNSSEINQAIIIKRLALKIGMTKCMELIGKGEDSYHS